MSTHCRSRRNSLRLYFSKNIFFCILRLFKKMPGVLRGALIIVEGCDRSGKTTQCKKLVESLQKANVKAQYINFPNRTLHTGQLIDKYLTSETDLPDEAIHLLFSANRWEFVPKILALLKDGITLIVDRYAFSGVAFSAAKGLNLDWCRRPDIGLPKPDRVFMLTIPMDKMVSRNGFGTERYERLEFQEKVMKNFSLLQDKSWEVIDADKSVESLQDELLMKCLKVTTALGSDDIGKLWMNYSHNGSKII